MDWLYLTTVSDQLSAEMLVQALRDQGIEALINPGDTHGYLGPSPYPCRVMVVADHWKQAVDLLESWEP